MGTVPNKYIAVIHIGRFVKYLQSNACKLCYNTAANSEASAWGGTK